MSTSTSTLHCPNCGGSVEPESIRCPWCESSLSAVACPSCFASIFSGMKHCPYCGAQVTPAKLSESTPEACPRCQFQLRAIEIGNSSLRECHHCGGLWVDKDTLQKICDDHEKQEAVLGLGEMETIPPSESPSASQRMYVPCPVCGTLMNRLNFAGCSGIVIDWCKPHGTWFDYNELPRIVSFIREGGLKKSREREKESIRSEMERMRLQEHSLAAESARLAGTQPATHWGNEDNNLLDFLSSVWKGLKEKP
jgi:Zn-finger nucleic acid-binding protein